jgi:hypothetical protein
MRTHLATRLVAALLGLCAAAGLYALGRATAHPGSYRKGLDAGYAKGMRDGHAQGVEEGRAAQETRALPTDERGSARAAYDDGYQAGANDVFTGYDGGWSYAAPYLVTLARGRSGITYRFASRTPLHPGVGYYLCPHSLRLCQEPRR